MKTHKNLYPQITDFDNLHQAWRKARRGKRYKPAAASFERNLDDEITLLHPGSAAITVTGTTHTTGTTTGVFVFPDLKNSC